MSCTFKRKHGFYYFQNQLPGHSCAVIKNKWDYYKSVHFLECGWAPPDLDFDLRGRAWTVQQREERVLPDTSKRLDEGIPSRWVPILTDGDVSMCLSWKEMEGMADRSEAGITCRQETWKVTLWRMRYRGADVGRGADEKRKRHLWTWNVPLLPPWTTNLRRLKPSSAKHCRGRGDGTIRITRSPWRHKLLLRLE